MPAFAPAGTPTNASAPPKQSTRGGTTTAASSSARKLFAIRPDRPARGQEGGIQGPYRVGAHQECRIQWPVGPVAKQNTIAAPSHIPTLPATYGPHRSYPSAP